MRVLTWHVHGSYLYYLAHAPHEFILPVKPGRPEGYGGRSGFLPWPDNVHEIAAEHVRDARFDVVLFQSRKNYLEDQFELLSLEQQHLPRIYLEHDPPRESPTDTRHVVDDPAVLIVHVTAFNALMWDSGRSPVEVIDHGVVVPDGVRYVGDLARGIVVVNGIASRGRRLGLDIFERAREAVPLDLAGIGSEVLGGLGDLPQPQLLEAESRYRLYFHPIRYTSLGLALLEAMAIGMPVVAVAPAEVPTVIENGVTGYADTNVDRLIEAMRWLLERPDEARQMGEAARRYAAERFGIERFASDWDRTLRLVAGRPAARVAAETSGT